MKTSSFKIALLTIGTVALVGVQNASALLTGDLNTSSSTATYTSASPDPTTTTVGEFTRAGGGSLTQTSGTLTINTGGAVWIGQTSAGSISLSGGDLTINVISGTPEFAVGNGGNGAGTVTVSGGTFNINPGYSSEGSSSIFYIGRNTSTGTVTVSGTGLLIATTQQFFMGTTESPTHGTGTVDLSGNGVFEVTGLTDFTSTNFAIDTGSTLNFTTGSEAEISLGSVGGAASLTFYDSLIDSGKITINGSTATTSDFTYLSESGQGILELVPEPSTYLMMGLGLVSLVAFRRFRRSNNA